jgi:hypothetical protein
MHEFLANLAGTADLEDLPEVYVGTVFQQAMRAGFEIRAVEFPAGRVLDLGTRDDVARSAGFFDHP